MMEKQVLRSENQGKTPLKSFTDLIAWQEGHVLVLAVYKITKDFPKEELFGLASQMRRCVVSISITDCPRCGVFVKGRI
jgi:hypothetical protein